MSGSVDAVIGISQFILKNHLEAGYFYNALATRVIHNSLIKKEKKVSPEAVVNEKPFTAGFLGRISRSKGIEELVNIFLNTDIPLIIGGKGDEELEKFITDLEGSNIQYMGYVDPDQFFQQIDLLVVPSKWNEPFGRVVIEAYSNGVPVLVSNRGGLPEIVDEGVTGYVTDINKHSVINVLEKLKGNRELLNELKSNALRKSKAFSTNSNIYQKHIEVYSELTSQI